MKVGNSEGKGFPGNVGKRFILPLQLASKRLSKSNSRCSRQPLFTGSRCEGWRRKRRFRSSVCGIRRHRFDVTFMAIPLDKEIGGHMILYDEHALFPKT